MRVCVYGCVHVDMRSVCVGRWVYLLLGKLGDGPPFWIFRTIWAMAHSFVGDYLGEDYG